MKFFERWWWPAFIPVYAIWAFPIPGLLNGGSPSKIAVAALWLAVGLILSWVAYPNVRLSDVVQLPRALVKHPPILVVLLFGIWTLVSSSFADYPGFSFSGTLYGLADGAIWNCTLCLIFVCVYLQTIRDPDLKRRLALSMLVTGLVIVALGTVEIVTKQGLFYRDADPSSLPLVGFNGRGHLMGVLAIAAGIGLAFWFMRSRWALAAVAALTTLIAASFHRAPWLAILPVVLLGWWVTKRFSAAMIAGAVVVASIALGIWMGTLANTGMARDLRTESSLGTRALLWRAAIGGIAERPVTGWGGGQFEHAFYKFWSEDQRKEFFKLEFGVTYKGVIGAGSAIPLFIVAGKNGAKSTTQVTFWKAHNQLLDIGVMWGLPGLILYITLVIFSLRGVFRLEPLAVGLTVYQIFLVTWFMLLDAEGIFFVLSAASSVVVSPIKQLKSENTL